MTPLSGSSRDGPSETTAPMNSLSSSPHGHPSTVTKAATEDAQDAVTLTGILDGWWKEAQATGRKPSTHESYRNTMTGLVAFLKHDDAKRVTPDDIVRFKDHRLATINPRTGKPVSAKTVKDFDLAGLKTLFAWAVSNRKLPSNPATGITIKLGKQAKLRGKGFTDAEAKAILRAALKPPLRLRSFGDVNWPRSSPGCWPGRVRNRWCSLSRTCNGPTPPLSTFCAPLPSEAVKRRSFSSRHRDQSFVRRGVCARITAPFRSLRLSALRSIRWSVS